jgi:hypothetical protein
LRPIAAMWTSPRWVVAGEGREEEDAWALGGKGPSVIGGASRPVPFSILRTSGACDRAIIRRVHSSVGDAGGSSKLVPSQ